MEIERAIKNVQAGKEADYTYIIQHYEHKVYTTVFRFVRQHDLAQDLVQDIFIKIFYNFFQKVLTANQQYKWQVKTLRFLSVF